MKMTTTITPMGQEAGILDQPSFATNTSVGVNLAEQSTPHEVGPNANKLTAVGSRAQGHLNDISWDLKNMLGRYNLCKTFTWDIGQSVGSTIESFSIPGDLLSLSIAATPFLRFVYWRCKCINIHVQLTASRYLSGRLNMYYVPDMGQDVPFTYNLVNMALLEHAQLDPSESTVVDFKIPFNYFKGWLNVAEAESMGRLQFAVFNQLVAATGTSTSVDVKVYASFDDSEFKVPVAQAVSYSSVTRAVNVVRQSGIAKTLGNVVDNAFHELAASIMPSEIIGDMIGGLLDKPEDPSQPQVVTRKDQAYLSNSRGAEPVEKMTLDPAAQQLVDPEHFSTVQDEMSIDYLLKTKKSFLFTNTWTDSQPVGTILFQQLVGPCINMLTAMENSQVTLLDYISANFGFWRGGIRYHFDIVATQFNEGRLDFVYLPGNWSTLSPSSYLAAQSVYLTSAVIRNGQVSFVADVPFLSSTVYKKVYNGVPLTTGSPITQQPFDDYTTGTVALIVSAPLTTTLNIPPTVEVNVYVSAAEDFELNVPTVFNNTLKIVDTISLTVQRQSGMVTLNQPADKNPTTDLAAASGRVSEGETPHFGEKYSSLREMAKRYDHCTTVKLSVDGLTADQTAEVNSGVVPLVTLIRVSPTEDFPGFFRRIFAMYRTFRGPMRFKLKFRATGSPATSPLADAHGYVIPYLGANPGYNPTPADVQYLTHLFASNSTVAPFMDNNTNNPRARYSLTQVAEFEVPYVSHTATTIIRRRGEALNAYNGNVSASWYLLCGTYLTLPLLQSVYLDVYMAFGDTTACGTFIGIPSYFPFTTAGGSSPYPDFWITSTTKSSNEWLVIGGEQDSSKEKEKQQITHNHRRTSANVVRK